MKTGCSYRSNHRVSELNNITINAPELLETWDWDENELSPDEGSEWGVLCMEMWGLWLEMEVHAKE